LYATSRSYRVHSLGNTISCFRSASSCFSSKKLHHHMQSSSVVSKFNSALAKELEPQLNGTVT